MVHVNLNCLISGEGFNDVFIININRNASIGILKDKIHKKRYSRSKFGSANLKIWKVDALINKNDSPSFDLLEPNQILANEKIDKHLDQPFREDRLHFIAKLPGIEYNNSSEIKIHWPYLTTKCGTYKYSITNNYCSGLVITLNCLVSGFPVTKYFQIEAFFEENVMTLQDQIKEKFKDSFDHIPFYEFKLMAVNIPLNHKIKFEEGDVMDIHAKIKSIFNPFSYNYNPEHLHVLISPEKWKEVCCIVKHNNETKELIWRVSKYYVTVHGLKDKIRGLFPWLAVIGDERLQVYMDHKSKRILLVDDYDDPTLKEYAQNPLYRINFTVVVNVV